MRRPWKLAYALAIAPLLAAATSNSAGAGAYATSPVVLNELAAGTSGFVELYTDSASPYDLNGHCVVYRSATATTDGTPLASFAKSTVIKAHGYYLLTGAAFTGVTGDVSYAPRSLSQVGGTLALRHGAPGTGTVVDAVAYGTAKNPFFTTTSAPAPTSGQSIARVPNGVNTSNNSSDFKRLATRTPGSPNQ